VPTGVASSKHPNVNGLATGATLGWEFRPDLWLIGNYEYTWAQSVNGSVPGFYREIQGHVQYHTISLGLRIARELGPGRIFGEMAAAYVFSFQTDLDVDYDAALGQLPTPITGSGKQTNHYNGGWGATAAMGYQYDLPWWHLYVTGLFRAKVLQSTNNGKDVQLSNFVVNPAVQPPVATTATSTFHNDVGPRPSTFGIGDIHFHLGIGWHF
jgi:hypothetical protein